MKDNKHPHHDLIVEWAKDTSKAVQFEINGYWYDSLMPTWGPDREYRIKPREFTKGHWYPCSKCNGSRFIAMFNGLSFSCFESASSVIIKTNDMKWVGESLGEIKFEGEL